MRSKVIFLLASMLILGISIAVYAYSSTPISAETAAAACCCCSGDSCPMKTESAKAGTVAVKADAAHSCCGDTCPMKAKGGDAKPDSAHSCCGDSCPMKGAKGEGSANHSMKSGDAAHSCPMMKGTKTDGHKTHAAGQHEGVYHGKAAGHAGCSCPCCGHSKEKKAEDAI